MKKLCYTAFAFLVLFSIKSHSQIFHATLKDSISQQAIPYASITYAPEKGIISNEEGKFSLDLSKINQDSIYISSIGYQQKGFLVNRLKDSVLFLNQTIENLDLVYLNPDNYSAKEIMEFVETNLDKNYPTSTSNQKVFFRKTYITKVKKFNIELKESSIPEINKKLLDSIKTLIPRQTDFFSEMLGNYYSNAEESKLIITKAAQLYDKDNSLSMEGIAKKLEAIFNKNVKRNSYLKVKSGFFGSKIQVDSILSENKKAKEIEEKLKNNDSIEKSNKATRNLDNFRRGISNLHKSLFYQDDPTFNIIDKINRYEYTLNGFTIINDEPCYIINFEPKGSKEFKGTLFINVNDFAIVQMDYTNVKILKSFSLLGISYADNLYNSKVFFRKFENGYIPYFVQLDKGQKFGIERPLKIIEKNKHVKGRNKQNEVSMEIEVTMDQFERSEFLVYETTNISNDAFKAIEENKNFNVKYLPKYDPTFWAEETIIAPNKAIESFSIKK